MHPRSFILAARRLALATILFSILPGPTLPAQSQDDGLNSLLGFNLWIDSTLWDDKADFTSRRLQLRGSVNGNTSFYRGLPPGHFSCLGTKLYALDLYGSDGYIQRVVLGFVNRADMSKSSSDPKSRLYDDAAVKEMTIIRSRLIQRLGQPNQRGILSFWCWELGNLTTLLIPYSLSYVHFSLLRCVFAAYILWIIGGYVILRSVGSKISFSFINSATSYRNLFCFHMC